MIDLMLGTRIGYNGNKESKAGDKDMWREGFYAYCREGFKGYIKTLTDKPYVLDKNRAWGSYYKLINEINPNPKIIFMVRDLRAVFASMEKNLDNIQILTMACWIMQNLPILQPTKELKHGLQVIQ